MLYLNNPYLIIPISLIVQKTVLKRLFEMNGENRRSEFQHTHFLNIYCIFLYILMYSRESFLISLRSSVHPKIFLSNIYSTSDPQIEFKSISRDIQFPARHECYICTSIRIYLWKLLTFLFVFAYNFVNQNKYLYLIIAIYKTTIYRKN